MKEIRVDNLVKLYILLLLKEKPHHGYEILKVLGEKLGRPVSAGQVYPFLRHLQNADYLSVKKAGGRDKKTYTLTKSGIGFLGELTERLGALMELGIKSRLKTCASCRCEIYRGSYCAKVSGKTLSFCCKSCWQSFRK